MISPVHYLAVDLGAESGRVMLGTLDAGRLSLEEIHRFATPVVTVEGHLHWNLAQLEAEIFSGLAKAAKRGAPISGISADAWGVDYVLLDRGGNALAQPFCYRDTRTEAATKRVFAKLPFAKIYEESGIQFMPINTIYQLEADQHDAPKSLTNSERLLFIADYFNARFCGVAVAEESAASTSQIYNPQTHDWSKPLISALDFPPLLFPRIVPSGTVLGPITGALREHAALAEAKVVATCSHDTGDAVAAVPALGAGNWAYLSSGTWSLLGAELPAPVITDAARAAGFTHEVGLGGAIRFLKNIAGLWVLQECRRAWEAGGKNYSYEELTRLATESPPARAHLALADPRFASTGDMPAKIAAFCRETSQPVPATPGEFARTILESLALTYSRVLGELESLIELKIETLHIVGGGTRNELLNQLTADAIGVTVVTGPVEATAIGNILIQALALGHLESAAHIRRIVEASFPTRSYKPGASFPEETRRQFAAIEAKVAR